jgi:uncharacterized protein (TIGR02266 family)
MVASLNREGRRSRRLHHDIPVAYRSVGRFLSDWATNISQGGIFINSRAPLAVGTTVRLMFQLPGTTFPCDLVGRVTRVVRWEDDVGDPPGMAIEFIEADREKRERIEAFVEALRSTLDPE